LRKPLFLAQITHRQRATDLSSHSDPMGKNGLKMAKLAESLPYAIGFKNLHGATHTVFDRTFGNFNPFYLDLTWK
jgi:hypothetical protein